jgi:hypothetical protein
MPKISLSHDELGMDGRVKTVRTEFETTNPPAFFDVRGNNLVRIQFHPDDGGGAVIVPIHALRFARYEPNDETETA